MERFLDFTWIIPALPALGAVVLLLFGKRIGEPKAGWLGTTTVSLSFVWSVITLIVLHQRPADQREHVYTLWRWFAGTGGFSVHFGFLTDPLSVTMILFVTGIGALIHLYSIGYMHGDARYSRFFAYLNLFEASMLVLVLGSSFLVTFMGWEGVGLCSYLLISFWFERNSAAVAGKKAFVTNRVGDFGFMLAMFLIFSKFHTLDYLPFVQATKLPAQHVTVTAIALLLFLGAAGKSAQFPLHIWLPDAMEGPTPVSALIHAATMVTAGVYLVSRAHLFYDLSAVGSGLHAGTVVAWIGAITALGAATVAIRQNDIKRVLAYSTLSQLGYMFLAAGVGAYSAAIFHMVTHAFFKALLFLGAGSVIHGMHNEQDMRKMGLLKKVMPITAGTFIIGWLAIAGVPPFAGFWSKDDILAKAWYSGGQGKALWAVGLVAALLTAFYMTRQVWLVFYGNERWNAGANVHDVAHDSGTGAASTDTAAPGGASPTAASAVLRTGVAEEASGGGGRPHAGEAGVEAREHEPLVPHESPPTMTMPLVVLAALSAVGGLLALPFTQQHIEFLTSWLEPSLRGAPELTAPSFATALTLSVAAIAVGLVGIFFGATMYRAGLAEDLVDPLERRLGAVGRMLEHAYYFDETLARIVSGPVTVFARVMANGVDRGVIDGAVNGLGRLVQGAGSGLRAVQTGRVRNYALAIASGTALLLVFMLTRVG